MSKYSYERERSDYLSPPVLVEMALKYFKIEEFDLDTCCSQKNIPAKRHYISDCYDGLTSDWRKYNWCNPPFHEAEKWVKKAYEEQKEGNFTAMLIPARTETAYWHKYILDKKNVKIKWLRKQYSFLNPDTGEPMGLYKNALALVYFKGIKPKKVENKNYNQMELGLF